MNDISVMFSGEPLSDFQKWYVDVCVFGMQSGHKGFSWNPNDTERPKINAWKRLFEQGLSPQDAVRLRCEGIN